MLEESAAAAWVCACVLQNVHGKGSHMCFCVYVCVCVCVHRHGRLLKLVPETYITELEPKGEDLTLQGE